MPGQWPCINSTLHWRSCSIPASRYICRVMHETSSKMTLYAGKGLAQMHVATSTQVNWQPLSVDIAFLNFHFFFSRSQTRNFLSSFMHGI